LKSLSGTAPITLADVPAPMRERHADAEGRFLLRVFARAPLWESENLKRFNDAVLAVAPGATGKPFTTWEGLVGMRAGFTRAGILALLAIVVVLAADFRSISCVLLALVPLAVGTAISLGVFGWLGWPLNPANMIALPLIVGVGVDNGVHVVHDWRARSGDGPYRMDPGTARGILVAGMTTVIGFGALMISDHRGLAGLGAILALGVGGSLATALVVLPRLLSAMGDSRGIAGPAILTGGFCESRPATRAA
jgi:predicted RND superfamily exporter protein